MIKVPSVLDGASYLKAGDMSLRFHTQEINDDEKIHIGKQVNTYGWLLFAGEGETVSVPKEPVPETGFKTPSQRLRAAIYKNWELNSDQSVEFETFYRQKVEALINIVKDTLPNERN